ncbi:phosphonate ABC transporter, periplasmic phosphonate binding protein [Serratia fonticola]|uniref:Phosphonate ABC transporter, periplasmic phosphonate binding protein n=1 Tax=Serratia fonticola TaxID=47917 RepID=A0A4V6KL52_SERFO|nr:phosphonate ABC transporter, periplasmic phosphonate binding protein [Serratia fonticola]
MKKVFTLTTMMAGVMMVFTAGAADAPKELNLGILGGQNATQQIGDNQCVKDFSIKS